jgi:hypothetical protein
MYRKSTAQRYFPKIKIKIKKILLAQVSWHPKVGGMQKE